MYVLFIVCISSKETWTIYKCIFCNISDIKYFTLETFAQPDCQDFFLADMPLEVTRIPFLTPAFWNSFLTQDYPFCSCSDEKERSCPMLVKTAIAKLFAKVLQKLATREMNPAKQREGCFSTSFVFAMKQPGIIVENNQAVRACY